MRGDKQITADESVSKGFSLKVTHRDGLTGQVTHSDPYTLRVVGTPEGGKMKLFERPSGSGNLWDSKNNPNGRWVVDPKTKKGKHMPDEAHIAFTPPETENQKIARTLIEKDARIAALEKEVASVKAEQTKSTEKSVEKKA